MSSGLVPIPQRDLSRAGPENLPAIIGRVGEAAGLALRRILYGEHQEQEYARRLCPCRRPIFRMVREASLSFARRNPSCRGRSLYRGLPCASVSLDSFPLFSVCGLIHQGKCLEVWFTPCTPNGW
jgi:hypothetical protein